MGIDEKLEFSLGRQSLTASKAAQGLGIPSLTLEQDIVGVKYKLYGDAVLNSDTWKPAVSVGLQYKNLDAQALTPTLSALGADTSGVDYYASATKLFLKQGILLNATARLTESNQNGLLGFGSNSGGYKVLPEFSVAKLLKNNLAVGAEYRFMNNDLEDAGRGLGLGNGLASDNWFDVFVAWAPTKNTSVTLAYVNLGKIVPATTGGRDQDGVYASVKFSF